MRVCAPQVLGWVTGHGAVGRPAPGILAIPSGTRGGGASLRTAPVRALRPVLLSLLRDSLARSSIKHLRDELSMSERQYNPMTSACSAIATQGVQLRNRVRPRAAPPRPRLACARLGGGQGRRPDAVEPKREPRPSPPPAPPTVHSANTTAQPSRQHSDHEHFRCPWRGHACAVRCARRTPCGAHRCAHAHANQRNAVCMHRG